MTLGHFRSKNSFCSRQPTPIIFKNAPVSSPFSFFLFSSPVLFNVNVPLPLEVLHLVVVGEERVDVIGPAAGHAGGGVVRGSRIALMREER
jgi:hypothetical protein